MRHPIPAFVLSVLAIACAPARAPTPSQPAADGSGLRVGAVSFPNSCSPAAQGELLRAVALLHSFWYDEARRRFTVVTDRDPRCAIGWWGVAMSYWQPLWEPRGPGREAFEAGADAIRRARDVEDTSPRERALIAALVRFYDDAGASDHLDRVLAYERAMEDVHASFPDDIEARVFYALSLLGSATSMPADKTYARQRRAAALLMPVFRAHSDHPGAAHYIIHAYDYPELASGALEAARRYAQIAPDSPHAQHMPSHIFTRLGLWDESIASNRRTIAAARKHGVVGEELHGMDYLVFAYLQQGRDRDAAALVRAMPAIESGSHLYFAGLHARAAIPARYAIERQHWAEAARLRVPDDFPGGRYAWANAAVYFARALGAVRTGDIEQARRDIDALTAAMQELQRLGEDYWATQVDVQRTAASAWLALAERDPDRALSLAQAAASLEDSTDKHPVTPGRIVPARALLGQMLLELGRPDDAAAAFLEALRVEPGRFGALYGAARATELAGDAERARELYASLIRLAPTSDRAELRHAREVVGVPVRTSTR